MAMCKCSKFFVVKQLWISVIVAHCTTTTDCSSEMWVANMRYGKLTFQRAVMAQDLSLIFVDVHIHIMSLEKQIHTFF